MGGLDSRSKMEGDGGVLLAKTRWWLGMIPIFFLLLSFWVLQIHRSEELSWVLREKKKPPRIFFFGFKNWVLFDF